MMWYIFMQKGRVQCYGCQNYSEYGEDFAARVLEVIEDADIDTSRRKYR